MAVVYAFVVLCLSQLPCDTSLFSDGTGIGLKDCATKAEEINKQNGVKRAFCVPMSQETQNK